MAYGNQSDDLTQSPDKYTNKVLQPQSAHAWDPDIQFPLILHDSSKFFQVFPGLN